VTNVRVGKWKVAKLRKELAPPHGSDPPSIRSSRRLSVERHVARNGDEICIVDFVKRPQVAAKLVRPVARVDLQLDDDVPLAGHTKAKVEAIRLRHFLRRDRQS
jgi:hypothetical protein